IITLVFTFYTTFIWNLLFLITQKKPADLIPKRDLILETGIGSQHPHYESFCPIDNSLIPCP
ncbi:hypothetical protein J7E95_28290, partial [Streptomyces sp. ISL-14]|nr:hypothetical protein [Streptomyces sp. ISL-14]